MGTGKCSVMKKLISYICVFALVLALAPAAFAEWDLSGFSYDDLVALKDQVQRAMWDSEDWQEVTVPQGVWEVGKQIPPGKWTIRCNTDGFAQIGVGDGLRDNGTKVTFPPKASATVYDPDAKTYSAGDSVEWTVELHEGEYVEITWSSVIFSPYSGAPSLGFK